MEFLMHFPSSFSLIAFSRLIQWDAERVHCSGSIISWLFQGKMFVFDKRITVSLFSCEKSNKNYCVAASIHSRQVWFLHAVNSKQHILLNKTFYFDLFQSFSHTNCTQRQTKLSSFWHMKFDKSDCAVPIIG